MAHWAKISTSRTRSSLKHTDIDTDSQPKTNWDTFDVDTKWLGPNITNFLTVF